MKYVAPAHYRTLALRKFRGFRSLTDVRLAPLTLVVGQNSSGKSSLVDALLLLAQSGFGWIVRPLQRPAPEWRGELVDLGSFSDTVYRHRSGSRMRIEVSIAGDLASVGWHTPKRTRRERSPIRIRVDLVCHRGDVTGRVEQFALTDEASGATITIRLYANGSFAADFDRKRKRLFDPEPLELRQDPYDWLTTQVGSFLDAGGARDARAGWERLRQFLRNADFARFTAYTEKVGAGRSGPRRWYPAENASPRLLSEARTFDLQNPAVLEDEGTDTSQIAVWLRKLDIADAMHPFELSPYHAAIRAKDSVSGVLSNLMDLGFGAAQVVPILLAAASGNTGPLFVEQPESHLHPRAQATIGEILADVSKRRQVIIETHSVHVINKARLLVASGAVPPKHVSVLFVRRTRTGTVVSEIGLDGNGDFTSEWPDGFFEERYDDTMRLLAIKQQRTQGK